MMELQALSHRPTSRLRQRPGRGFGLAMGLSLGWSLGLSLGLVAPPAAAQSLYNEATFQSLTADRRAHRVGDLITVLVFETASATQSANTTTEKNAGLNVALKAGTREGAVRVGVGDDFTGRGQIQRSGRLAAQISVNVESVEPNGDLRVSGRQEIIVNGETQLLMVAGRVRPVDLSETNTVASTRLADAAISYVGDGILAEKQRQGVITRFMSWLGLL